MSLEEVFEKIARAAGARPEPKPGAKKPDAGERPEDSFLATSLDCAVPLWMMKFADTDPDVLIRRAGECAQVVAEKGDLILYRSKVKGETARVFNTLAEGIAILALVAPGGVRLFGRHWEKRPA